MRKQIIHACAIVFLATAGVCGADTLELKNGTAIQGKCVGGTAATVNMETAQGVLAVSTADALVLTFSPPPPPPPPVVVIPPPPPPVSFGPVSVPAGSVLTVRMDSQVSSKDSSGKKFTGKLLADLMAGNVVVARAGTTVIGQVEQSKQAGRLAGKSQLQMTLVSIDLSGKLAPILTSNFAETGKSSFKKTARNVAGGAVIGNAFDRSGGAGKGAAVGVGASLIREGDSVTVPPGAILEFRLIQPLNLTVGQ
jgi:hypothetical protein